eukprot:8204988-Lingulodinium_polyedra.AAC.1
MDGRCTRSHADAFAHVNARGCPQGGGAGSHGDRARPVVGGAVPSGGEGRRPERWRSKCSHALHAKRAA